MIRKRDRTLGKIDAIASRDRNAIAFPLCVLLPVYIELRTGQLQEKVYVYL